MGLQLCCQEIKLFFNILKRLIKLQKSQFLCQCYLKDFEEFHKHKILRRNGYKTIEIVRDLWRIYLIAGCSKNL